VAIGVAITDAGDRDIDKIFSFRSNTDTLILLESEILDREVIPFYQFTVVATDGADQTSTATVTVTLADFNDQTPVITNGG